jgi:hypothetical protein
MASPPLDAWATSCISGWLLIKAAIPWFNKGWSSTLKTRMGMGSLICWSLLSTRSPAFRFSRIKSGRQETHRCPSISRSISTPNSLQSLPYRAEETNLWFYVVKDSSAANVLANAFPYLLQSVNDSSRPEMSGQSNPGAAYNA